MLIESMRGELRECAWLLTLMDSLQKAIIRRDAGAVAETTKEIEEQVAVVERSSSDRVRDLEAQSRVVGLSPKQSLKSLIPFAPPQLRPLFSALCEEAESLQERIERRVRQNSSLLSRSGAFASEMLEVLRPTSVIRTYNRSGIVGRSSSLSGSVIKTAV